MSDLPRREKPIISHGPNGWYVKRWALSCIGYASKNSKAAAWCKRMNRQPTGAASHE